jgi:enamine deaminase RidA (YjgF/YER057c/UK114 family)
VGWNEKGEIVSPDFTAQFEKALANVLTVVRAAGGGPDSVVRLTIYVVDRKEYLANLKGIGKAYREQMGSHYPAMTLLEVKGLLEEGAKVELEATAAL